MKGYTFFLSIRDILCTRKLNTRQLRKNHRKPFSLFGPNDIGLKQRESFLVQRMKGTKDSLSCGRSFHRDLDDFTDQGMNGNDLVHGSLSFPLITPSNFYMIQIRKIENKKRQRDKETKRQTTDP
jgi:hypothetical protein